MELIAWGANSHGQLGNGIRSEFEQPKKITSIPAKISTIAGGAGHSILIDDDGHLWATGWNNKGQLGISSFEDQLKFQKLKIEKKFNSICCGWDSSAGITISGELYVWGSNNYCQLGLSNIYNTISTPTELKLPQNEMPQSIAFGLRHLAILTHTNCIYIIGSVKHFKSFQQLWKHEIVCHNSCEYLRLIPNVRILHMSSGQNHITFLDDRNIITAIGNNKFGQCSVVECDVKIVGLGAGWTHNGYLTASKELFLYGRNNYGQLGNGVRCATCKTPQKCQIHPIDDFAIGAEHGILVSNGDVYTWGWNEHGNCGNGSTHDVLIAENILIPSSEKIKSVHCGSGFCLVLLDIS